MELSYCQKEQIKKKKQLGSTIVPGGVAMLSHLDEFWTLQKF